MEDAQIVSLYWARCEDAIRETDAKYGAFCRTLAGNILSSREDAEECVNDTWHHAWNAMPEERPSLLRAWLGKVVRNLALDRWRSSRAQKRYDGMELLLSELEDCVPARETVEESVEAAELGRIISAWLAALPEDDAALFVRRYWNGDALNALAKEQGVAAAKLAQKMYRLRLSLKTTLEQEGIAL